MVSTYTRSSGSANPIQERFQERFTDPWFSTWRSARRTRNWCEKSVLTSKVKQPSPDRTNDEIDPDAASNATSSNTWPQHARPESQYAVDVPRAATLTKNATAITSSAPDVGALIQPLTPHAEYTSWRAKSISENRHEKRPKEGLA
jgi:hypothetical protein